MKAPVNEIRTKDGKQIPVTVYLPPLPGEKVLIFASTGSQLRSFYEPFALYARARGLTVISFDYRGLNELNKSGSKNYLATMHQWAVQDIDAVLRFAKHEFPHQEIIYLGHCVGGEIVGLAQGSQYISRLILVNSALSCSKFWKWRDRFRVLGNRFLIRALTSWYGYFPARKLGAPINMPASVMRQWSNWCAQPNGLFDSYPDSNYQKLQIPILAYSFSDDWHCPPKAVEELLSRFSSASISWHHYQPRDLGLDKVGHIGFFEQEKMERKLWAKTIEWIK